MNETSMKPRSVARPEIRQRQRTNIPVEVYTCGEGCGITQVTVQSDGWGVGTRPRQGTGRLSGMKAIVISRLGGPEVLELRDMPDPVPRAGRVLVRVQAGGLNF